MEIIADLHIHSSNSRATGKDLNLENLEKWANIKGVTLLGTGDFTHPKWIEEIKTKLTETEPGIYRSKTGFPFMLQTEISLIYTDLGKGRKVHHIVYAPDVDSVKKITDWLLTRGRIDYDGRPIFGIPSDEFVENLKDIDERIEIVPAHIWTPWFALFGSRSGYDKIEDCFKDMTKHVFALETGLSSDPEMNFRLSSLDKYTLVSNSDLHSFWPWRMGREANMFDLNELSYVNIIQAMKSKEGFTSTIEVDPAYGKYHWSGHRNCKVNFDPKTASKHNNICPKCRKPLTQGVEQRVDELADREPGYLPKDYLPYTKLIPLSDIISIITKKGVATKTVWKEYNQLVRKGKSEFEILRKTPITELSKITSPKIADAIIKNREGKIKVIPGYDGEYGIPILENSNMESPH